MSHSHDRRQAILKASVEQFAHYGYAGTSMRQIAEAAGVTKGGLYHHFPNKETLFKEALEETLAQLQDRILSTTEGITAPLPRLRALVHAYLTEFVEERGLIRRLHALFLLTDPVEPWVAEIFSRHGQPLRAALEDCVAAGHVAAERQPEIAVLLIGAIEHLGTLTLLDEEPMIDFGFVDRLLEHVIPDPAPQRRPRRCSSKTKIALVPWIIGCSLAGGAGHVAADEPASIAAIAGGNQTLTLDDCLDRALGANAALQAEKEGRGELEGQMLQARATGLPTLDVTGNWSRGKDPSFAMNEAFSGGTEDTTGGSALDSLLAGFSFLPDLEDTPVQTYWRTSLNAHWHLNPGLIYNAVGAAGLGIKHQDQLILVTEYHTIESVMTAYYGVILAGEALATIDADISSKHEFLEVTRRRFATGFSTALDTLRAAVSLANLTPQRRSAAQQLRDAGSQLNVLMGQPPLAPIAVATTVPLEQTPIDPDAALTAISKRPDLRQIRLMTEMLRKNRGAQKSEHRPYVSADASLGYVSTVFDELTDKGHDFWSASVTLNVPLFDGLLTKGKIEQTEATIRRTEYQEEDALRRARLEVISLLGDLEAARDNLDASRLNLTAAEDALQQMTLRYELGKADYLAVLEVQAARSFARSNHIQARHQVLTLTASLKRAMGFSPRLALEAVAAQLAAGR